MKKVIFMAVAALMVAVSANAQKGDWVLSGRLSGLDLNYAFADDYTNNAKFNIGANVGHFLSDKFMLDATLGLDYTKVKDVDANTAFAFGVGARYYFAGDFFGRIGYDGLKKKDVDLASYLGVSVGYDWFISDKVFFEPAVYYQKNLAKGGENNLGLSLGVGVKF